jgi:hypothetical protein
MYEQQLPLGTAVAALVSTATAVFLSTWSRSPFYLPLPPGPHTRWLRSIPVLATVVIVGILITWSDCSYLPYFFTAAVASFVVCAALIIVHLQVLEKGVGASSLLVLVCFGWSISGTLCVSVTATMVVVKTEMDHAYRAKPLTLWRLIDGRKEQPSTPIYLTAGLPAHFRAEFDECHEDTAALEIWPHIGRLNAGTYFAPDKIAQEQQVKLTAVSKRYGDKRSAAIILLPDSSSVLRKSYPITDKQGRPAVLDLIIISRTDSWLYKSDSLIERNRLSASAEHDNIGGPTPVCRAILDLAKSHAFEPYVDIIAVGTASREGRQIEEDGRAGRRGQNIARWINYSLQATQRRKHVYFLNLGQYRTLTDEAGVSSPDETAGERPVVLLGIVRAGDIDLQSTLDEVLRRYQNDKFFKFLVSHYPRRDIARFTEVSAGHCD